MKKDLIHLIYLCIILVSIIILFQLFLTYSDKMETISNTIGIQTYVEDNNLNMPFPYWEILGSNTLNVNELMKLNLTDFHEVLNRNYIYNDLYDCKYWTYVWSNYWVYNKNDYDLKVIKTNNHIFAILSNDEMYCIADQKNLNCIQLTQN